MERGSQPRLLQREISRKRFTRKDIKETGSENVQGLQSLELFDISGVAAIMGINQVAPARSAAETHLWFSEYACRTRHTSRGRHSILSVISLQSTLRPETHSQNPNQQNVIVPREVHSRTTHLSTKVCTNDFRLSSGLSVWASNSNLLSPQLCSSYRKRRREGPDEPRAPLSLLGSRTKFRAMWRGCERRWCDMVVENK